MIPVYLLKVVVEPNRNKRHSPTPEYNNTLMQNAPMTHIYKK